MYLKHQNEVVSSNHEHQEPIRDIFTCNTPQLLPVKPALKVTDATKYEMLMQVLASEDEYMPVFLNDMLLSDKRDRYRFIQSLKEGFPIQAILYTHSLGNNVGNMHFMWHVPDEQSECEVLCQSASVIPKVQEQIPHFYTRAMRSRFI